MRIQKVWKILQINLKSFNFFLYLGKIFVAVQDVRDIIGPRKVGKLNLKPSETCARVIQSHHHRI